MLYFIDRPTGCVYWKENDPIDGDYICFAPLLKDGTFNTEDGGIVEQWDTDEVQTRVMQALKFTA